jgi:hypothetical protein
MILSDKNLVFVCGISILSHFYRSCLSTEIPKVLSVEVCSYLCRHKHLIMAKVKLYINVKNIL